MSNAFKDLIQPQCYYQAQRHLERGKENPQTQVPILPFTAPKRASGLANLPRERTQSGGQSREQGLTTQQLKGFFSTFILGSKS